jgi:hypothetical protein
MRVALPIALSPEQQEVLEQCARARSLSVRFAEHARIVLLCAELFEIGRLAMGPRVGEFGQEVKVLGEQFAHYFDCGFGAEGFND